MALKDVVLDRLVSVSECGELTDRTVYVNRVAKVVKGGKRFSFNALVVVGDKAGSVGFGLGKAAEVPDAIRKASEQARKNMVKVGLRGTTIPHEVLGKFSASTVLLRPAPPGTGVIAGATVRAVVEAVGIQDIVTKVVGRSNPFNVLQATFAALLELRAPETVADARKMKIEDLGYAPY